MAEEDKGQKSAKKAKQDKEEGAEAQAPKRRFPLKLIIVAVAALAVLGGGGYAAWQHLGGGAGGHAPASTGAHEETGGHTLRLDQFIVNLVDPLGRRYLKVQIELEMDSLQGVEEASKRNAQIRDSIITLLTSKGYSDVESPEGKLQLRQEIIARVNQFLHQGKAVNAYFTDFVVQ